MLMWSQKVIVSNPECKIVVGSVDVIKAVGWAVIGFISSVEPFDHLLVGTVSGRHFIVIGQSDHLCDVKFKLFAVLAEKLLGGEWIGTVSASNKTEVFRKFFQMPKCHTHCKDAGTDTAIIGYLITDDGAFCCIHNKPDISFDPSDFDVGFIGSKYCAGFVVKVVNEGFYTDGCGFAVVGDALMGDGNVVDVFQSLPCFTERQTKIDTVCQTESHDI